MSAFALSFGNTGFSGPAESFAFPQGGTILNGGQALPTQPSTPAPSFDPGDPGSYIPAIDNLSGVALAFLKQVQGNDLQNEIVAANKGQGGAVVTPGGTTAVGAGALSGAFGSSSGTFLGIPIMYIIIGAVLLLLFRR